MPDIEAAVHAFGLRIEWVDFGPWPAVRLISEYDGAARMVRLNVRALEAYAMFCGSLNAREVQAFVDLALAHELYHHRERLGEVVRLRSRAAREDAADAAARAQVTVDSRLALFLEGGTRARC